MTLPAIKVEGLWKEYVLRHARHSHGTFYELLAGVLKSPLHGLRRLSGEAEEAERFWALRDVSFEIQPGEVVGLIGRNGAGKSTLLKILSRITAPTRGRIEVHGRLASLLEVGTGFHPELSGRENIYLNGAILGMTRKEVARKFADIVEFAEIEKFIDTPVKRYSSGMYVRLAFAVAAHLEPDILLVDEVLAVGDIAFQRKCLGKMENVSNTGRTVVFVSHNMDAIRKLCKSALLFDKGGLYRAGNVFDVSSVYLDYMQESVSGNIIPLGDESAADFDIPRIEVLNGDGTPKSRIHTWDEVIFRIVIRASHPLKGGAVALQITTLTGAAIHLCSTQPDRGFPVSFEPGINFVDCRFPRLLLAAGKYRVGAGITIPNVQWLCNKMEEGALTVECADVYNSGLSPDISRYLVPVDYEWGVHVAPRTELETKKEL
jgi:lipopolysaccharide transport system ATP-binding protein